MIQIIKGTYGYYDGKKVVPKRADDLPFSLDADKEARLVSRGVAKYVTGAQAALATGEPPAYNIGMKLDDLKRIALEGYGVDASKASSKTKVIELIEAAKAVQFTKGDDNSDDDAENVENVDEPPKLEATMPDSSEGNV